MAGKILLIGYGNPGRLDDGLGAALAEAVAGLALPGVTVESDYQLAVEDAAAVAAHEVVIFADASVNGPEPFTLRPVQPATEGEIGFSTHSIEPEAVLALARDLFHARTRGYALGIRGYRFNEFGERLSDQAEANLAAALRFLVPVLRDGRFEAAVRAAGGAAPPAETRTCPCETEST